MAGMIFVEPLRSSHVDQWFKKKTNSPNPVSQWQGESCWLSSVLEDVYRELELFIVLLSAFRPGQTTASVQPDVTIRTVWQKRNEVRLMHRQGVQCECILLKICRRDDEERWKINMEEEDRHRHCGSSMWIIHLIDACFSVNQLNLTKPNKYSVRVGRNGCDWLGTV